MSLTSGTFNTAVGFSSLKSNTIGNVNMAIGVNALSLNTTGFNTANGGNALYNNTTGSRNTANGVYALFGNTIGSLNTASGAIALLHNTTGSANTAIGVIALSNNFGSGNTAIGNNALSSPSGNSNTALGAGAGGNISGASNVICVGAGVLGDDYSNTTWIGNIYQTTTINSTTLPVIVSSRGQLGTTSSSRRFKKEIKPMDKASESILALKPVTFHYKSDKTNTPQFGLIAEEVADVQPDLVARDKNGDIYTVRYDAVNAMLLNEFLKEHRKVENLEATVASLAATVKEQAAQLQKVSAEVEINKPVVKVAGTNR